MSRSKILFMMSGSIAAFKACTVISKLVQDGHEVRVVATPSTFEFIGKATMEGLTNRAPLSDLWERGQAMEHIHLTRWADFGLLCPASANTLAKLAHGFGDDLVSAMALAWPKEKSFFIFPAMNHEMLSALPTQENLERLRARGFKVEDSADGSLACGENGAGRLLEPDQILKRLFKAPRGRLLVTAGATREPIDGIRFLTNVSTGRTAATLADRLNREGWEISYLHGEGSALPRHAPLQTVQFSSFADLDEKLHVELSIRDYVGVVHAAAVGDYGLDRAPIERKISSDEILSLQLKPNYKILPRLKEYSRNKEIKVVGFKLTLNASEGDRRAAALKALSPSVDAVVSNDWSEAKAANQPTTLYTRAGAFPNADLNALANNLNSMFSGEVQ